MLSVLQTCIKFKRNVIDKMWTIAFGIVLNWYKTLLNKFVNKEYDVILTKYYLS